MKKTRTKARMCGIAFAFLIPYALGAQQGRPFSHPIAIDRHPRGDLYVLDQTGSVTELGLQPGSKGQMRSIVSSGSRDNYGTQVVDIVAAAVSGLETLFVSSTNDGRSKIQQLSLDGKVLQTINLPMGGSGFDIDVGSHILYVASAFGGDVFKVDLPGGAVSPAFSIQGALSLGPLVISQGQKSVYVADQKTGTVYQVSILTGQVLSTIPLEAQPVALAFDERLQILYVADARQGRVYRIAANSKRLSTIETHVSNLTGVAPGPLGSIFVSNGDSGSIVNIAQNGSLIEQYPRNVAALIRAPTQVASDTEAFSIDALDVRALTSAAFKRRVCLAVGHIDSFNGHAKPFHLYIVAAKSPVVNCPNHDAIRAQRHVKGNIYWEIKAAGEERSFSLPAISSAGFALRVTSVSVSPPRVEIEIIHK